MCVDAQALDTDKSGTVTVEELKEGLLKQGSPVTQNELQQLVESMDFDANGSIDYDEFLAATINMSQLQARPPSPCINLPPFVLETLSCPIPEGGLSAFGVSCKLSSCSPAPFDDIPPVLKP